MNCINSKVHNSYIVTSAPCFFSIHVQIYTCTRNLVIQRKRIQQLNTTTRMCNFLTNTALKIEISHYESHQHDHTCFNANTTCSLWSNRSQSSSWRSKDSLTPTLPVYAGCVFEIVVNSKSKIPSSQNKNGHNAV